LRIAYIVNFIFSIFLFNGCSSKEPIPLNLHGNILYIEDVDGSGGTTAGNFGDIMTFDLKNGKQFRITDDNYYDEHPTYSPRLNKILFESKRIGASKIAGLTSKTNLFYFSLNKKVPELINFKGSNDISDRKKINFHTPQFDKEGNNFAFISLNPIGFRNALFYYKINEDSLRILTDSLISPLTYTFGNNKIYFTSKIEDKFGLLPNSINSIDIETTEVKVIVPSRKTEYFYLGDESNEKLLYLDNYIGNFNDLTNYSINIFHLKTKKNEILTTSRKLGLIEIKTPVFSSDSTIYYIGNKAKRVGEFDEDIYEMNINTKKVKRITYNGHIKESLSFCR